MANPSEAPPTSPETTRSRRSSPRSRTPAEIWMVDQGVVQPMPDDLATEEPLEIRLAFRASDGGEQIEPVAVTMRTPGSEAHSDAELAAGFLHGEGVVQTAAEIRRFRHLTQRVPGRAGGTENVVVVELTTDEPPDLATLDRHFYTSSACGVCGKASLDALLLGKSPKLPPGPRLTPEMLYSLPEKLRSAQGVFRATGGLHAAALFDARGDLLAVREDVGRHNALDKLLGWALLEDRLPLHDHLVMVSGRTSYEILQKSLMAEVPVVCAVSAPSSLAVALAHRFDITLVGFLRDRRCNVYAGFERLHAPR